MQIAATPTGRRTRPASGPAREQRTPAAPLAVIALAGSGLLSACSDESAPTTGDIGRLADATVVLRSNQQNSEVPCVGVEVTDGEGTTATTSCPTGPAEPSDYGAEIIAADRRFVVGFGLERGETITNDGLRAVFISDEIDGRRYFAAEVAGDAALEQLTIDSDAGERTVAVLPAS